MSDKARIMNDLEVIVTTIQPDIDSIKLKIRMEEIIERYTITLKIQCPQAFCAIKARAAHGVALLIFKKGA